MTDEPTHTHGGLAADDGARRRRAVKMYATAFAIVVVAVAVIQVFFR